MRKIYYARTDEFWRKGEKYAFLEERQHVGGVEWQELQPDAKHNWLTEGLRDDYEKFLPLGSKESRTGRGTETIFRIFSNGLKSNRDIWVYNFDAAMLEENMKRSIETYNDHVSRWGRKPNQDKNIDDFIIYDGSKISWSRDLKLDVQRGKYAEFIKDKIRRAVYRPFTKTFVFTDKLFNEEVYSIPLILPTPAQEEENRIVSVVNEAQIPFSSQVTNYIPCLHYGGRQTQCFPFYIYDEDGTNRRENITDWALEKFRERYGDASITKWDIFHYVYAVLHHPVYRERYGANLKRELPRVPFVGASADIFRAFVEAGARLADIHVNYERQPEYPLEKVENPSAPLSWRVERMRLSKDRTRLVYNDFLTLAGVPPDAFEYRLGNRSALEWVVDQYQVSTDKRSGITNDPNRADDPQYVVRLVGQVVTVSLETVGIVRGLPGLEIDSA